MVSIRLGAEEVGFEGSVALKVLERISVQL